MGWVTWRKAGEGFLRHEMPLHAAALAFFSLLAAAPLFAAITLGARLVLGTDDAAQARIGGGARVLFGDSRGEAVVALVEGTSDVTGGVWGFLLVTLMSLFAAAQLFSALAATMNRVFEVRADGRRDPEGTVRKRARAFSILVGIGFLLLVSLVLSSLAAGVIASVPWLRAAILVEIARLVVVAAVIALALLPLYRHVPDAHVQWGDVWRASLYTGVLLAGGERLVGLAMGEGRMRDMYGSFAPVIFVLVWAYYTSLIVLLGAEFVSARAHARGEEPPPEGHARRRDRGSEG